MLSRLELTPTHCIKTVLQPLLDNIHIPINGSLNCKDIFASVLGMATWNRSIHSIKTLKQKKKLDIAIDVKYRKGKRGKNGCENLGFVVYGIDWDPRKVSDTYRKRFAIESSYRMRNVVKPKKCSKDPMLRYFYALISFLFKNAWVSIQRMHFMKVKRGPKTIEEDDFRLDLFVHFVYEWVRKKLKVKLVVKCYR